MKTAILCVGLALSVGACKKSGGGGGGGSGGSGGGGGGWMIGELGLMINVMPDGSTSRYNLDSKVDLNAIACRYLGEAWVVGDQGTLLYTKDGGASWLPQALSTTADLRAVATQDWGPVFVGGDGVLLTSTDTGRSWRAIGDGTLSIRSLAAAQDAEVALAVSEDGGVWSYTGKQLTKLTAFDGARAVAISPDGQTAMVVGDNLLARSTDGGQTWTQLSGGDSVRYDAVRIDGNGRIVAVGQRGTIAHVSSSGSVVMQHIGGGDLHTVHVAEPDGDYGAIGYTAGQGGQIYLTNDGGWTWAAAANAGGTILAADMIGENHN